MRATSIALASSTEIRSGLAICTGASAGASIVMRECIASGFVITVIDISYSAGTCAAPATALPSFLVRYSS